MIEVFIVIKDGAHQYYLLKVVRRGFDVYCFPPHLGVHYSLHESGESHFQSEGKTSKPREELPVAMMMGEAGTPRGKGIIREHLVDLGRASCIYTTIYLIDSLNKDFQKFNRSPAECFVIDKDLFSKDVGSIEIGIWAVPERNKVSFEFNNPNIPADLLHKVTKCEPQIWIYARPF
jgi:hypothetical protein